MKLFIYVFISVVFTFASGYPKPSLFGNVVESIYNSWENFKDATGFGKEVVYNLFTKKNPTTPRRIENLNQLNNSNFDPAKLSIFITHTWAYNRDITDIYPIKGSAVKYHDINVFVTTWVKSSLKFSYSEARSNLKNVGLAMGNFINGIQDKYGLNGTSFLLVGHGLGAHIVGNAGAVVKSKIERIVGLDPSRLEKDSDDALKKSDANYVEIIHTGYGIVEPIGHVDYYPNGGVHQPHCAVSLFNDLCSHKMANKYFAESLRNGPVFEAVKCDTLKDFEYGKCQNNSRSVMGKLIKEEKALGTYYLKTKKKSPYALGKDVFYGMDPNADTNVLGNDTMIEKDEIEANVTNTKET